VQHIQEYHKLDLFVIIVRHFMETLIRYFVTYTKLNILSNVFTNVQIFLMESVDLKESVVYCYCHFKL
jgi:hypothetical protein